MPASAEVAKPHGEVPPHIPLFSGRDLGAAAVLFCATLAAYWPALHGAMLWDDSGHVTKPALQSMNGLWRIWSELGATQQYYPLLHTAFWFEHRLWGDAVVGYHLTNLFLHTVAACLVVVITRRLSLPGSWLAGFVFALHPVCVEAVAWISEQKTTLSTVFYLLSLLACLEFDRTRRRSQYLLGLVLFLMALSTKTVTASLPAALFVILWARRGRLEWKRDVWPFAPWLVVGAAAGVLTAWVEHHFIGARGSEFALALPGRLLLAGRVIWFYLAKLFWPADLVFIYPRWTIDAAVWWQYLFPLGVLAGAWMLWKLAPGRPGRRAPLAGFLFFAGTLFPALGFFNVYPFIYSFVADHFQYLASLGVFVPVSAGLALAVRRYPTATRAALPTAALLITVLGVLTRIQSGMYRDSTTLFTETLARNPAAWMAHNNLALELIQVPGRQSEAMAHLLASLRIKPHNPVAHYDLGILYESMPGRISDALAEYQAALRSNPNYEPARAALGLALAGTPGRQSEAIEQYEIGLRINPDSTLLHRRLGNALSQAPGRSAEAAAQYIKALGAEPGRAETHFDLANTLADSPGQLPAAAAEYRAALAINPDYAEAHLNLGSVLSRMPGRTAEALAEFQAALRVKPNYPEAHFNLGTALSDMPGRTQEAIAEYQAALRGRPDYPEAHLNLGLALETLRGRLPDAIAEYQAALRGDPSSAEAHYALAEALAGIPGRLPEAVSHLEASVRIRPDMEPAREMLASLRGSRGGKRR